MSDPINDAARVLSLAPWEDLTITEQVRWLNAAGRLAEAGLLVTPAHDAAVAAKALRDMRDEMSRWEGWDTRDIGHAFLSESVLDALDDAADRIEREGGGDV